MIGEVFLGRKFAGVVTSEIYWECPAGSASLEAYISREFNYGDFEYPLAGFLIVVSPRFHFGLQNFHRLRK